MNEKIVPVERQQHIDQMKRCVAENKIYGELLTYWSHEDVAKYLRYVAGNDAEVIIADIESESIAGYATDFHERFEMHFIEQIVDAMKGEGAYRRALEQGNLDDYEQFDTGKVTWISESVSRKIVVWPYLKAHPQAMRAEMVFLKEISSTLGINISLLALFVARPTNWEEFAGTSKTIQEFYNLHRRQNLSIKEDASDDHFPKELPQGFGTDLKRAVQFYTDFGSIYEVSPNDILVNNGLN